MIIFRLVYIITFLLRIRRACFPYRKLICRIASVALLSEGMRESEYLDGDRIIQLLEQKDYCRGDINNLH